MTFLKIFFILAIGLIYPAFVFASSSVPESVAAEIGEILPLWSVLPFVGILLSIALIPLLATRFWERHFPKVSAFWALVFAVPFLFFFRKVAVHEIAHIIIIDYIPFILLLWSLYAVSGGIYIRGSLQGSPGINTATRRIIMSQ